MRHFHRFLSTFGFAHHNFRESGRQKSDISHGFCLLPGPRTTISESQVDKNQTFTPVFVYFRGPRTTISESQVDKIHTFLPVFVYFQSHAPKFDRNYQRCYKDYVKSKTLPNGVANGTAFPTKRDFIHLFPKTPKNAGPICRCVIIIIFI